MEPIIAEKKTDSVETEIETHEERRQSSDMEEVIHLSKKTFYLFRRKSHMSKGFHTACCFCEKKKKSLSTGKGNQTCKSVSLRVHHKLHKQLVSWVECFKEHANPFHSSPSIKHTKSSRLLVVKIESIIILYILVHLSHKHYLDSLESGKNKN